MPLAPPPFSDALILGDQPFEWTTRGADFLFRPRAAPPDVIWVLPGNSYLGAQLRLPMSPHGRVEPVYPAPLKIYKALQGQTFWRLWHLNRDEELLIRPRGSLLRTRDGQSVGFTVATPPNFATADTATMARWIAQLSDADDWQAARHWLELSQTQKLAQLVDVSGGSWPELLDLIDAAFVLWANPEARILHTNLREKLELDLTKSGRVSLRQVWYEKPLEQPVDFALELLSQHWSVERVSLKNSARWWRHCDEFADPVDVPKLRFEWKDASQHERLESLLLWRNWLNGKLAPAQIQAMLVR